MSKTIELEPDFAFPYFVRGVLYAQTGEQKKAISDLETALELGLEPGAKQEAEAFLEELNFFGPGQNVANALTDVILSQWSI